MNKKFTIFGSSSACCFENLFPNTYKYQASTAKGLNNINSRSNVNEKICNIIDLLSENSDIIFFFGEVDLSFVINYKFNKNNKFNCEKYIIEAAEHYVNFVKKNTENMNIYICEVPISHVKDQFLIKIINSYKKQKIDSWEQSINPKVIPHKIRNQYILSFNSELERLCKINDFKFLEINKYFKNSLGHYEIPLKYIKKNILDHHLKNNIVELYLNSLKILK
ncbi:MAG: hypothetical protein P8J69_04100 [Flavobacteriaceae bacterium]|nr:hypothetical protein [Flavobacteriaceae bacterium]